MFVDRRFLTENIPHVVEQPSSSGSNLLQEIISVGLNDNAITDELVQADVSSSTPSLVVPSIVDDDGGAQVLSAGVSIPSDVVSATTLGENVAAVLDWESHADVPSLMLVPSLVVAPASDVGGGQVLGTADTTPTDAESTSTSSEITLGFDVKEQPNQLEINEISDIDSILTQQVFVHPHITDVLQSVPVDCSPPADETETSVHSATLVDLANQVVHTVDNSLSVDVDGSDDVSVLDQSASEPVLGEPIGDMPPIVQDVHVPAFFGDQSHPVTSESDLAARVDFSADSMKANAQNSSHHSADDAMPVASETNEALTHYFMTSYTMSSGQLAAVTVGIVIVSAVLIYFVEQRNSFFVMLVRGTILLGMCHWCYIIYHDPWVVFHLQLTHFDNSTNFSVLCCLCVFLGYSTVAISWAIASRFATLNDRFFAVTLPLLLHCSCRD